MSNHSLKFNFSEKHQMQEFVLSGLLNKRGMYKSLMEKNDRGLCFHSKPTFLIKQIYT